MDEGSRLPPLPAIRVFEAAARHLSFTKAAAELGMTQAAVSYQIRLLEDRVGAPLFLRLTRKVALTETGERLAPAVTEALARLAGAFAAARDDTGGLLSITSIHTFATNWLVPRLGRFQLAHPGIAVRLDTKTTMVDFTRGDSDIGIRHGMGVWPGLAAHPLMPIEYTALCSPALRDRAGGLKDPRDLLEVPLFWDDGDGYWQRWFAAAGLAVPRTVSDRGLRLENQQMMGRAAQAGQGWPWSTRPSSSTSSPPATWSGPSPTASATRASTTSSISTAAVTFRRSPPSATGSWPRSPRMNVRRGGWSRRK